MDGERAAAGERRDEPGGRAAGRLEIGGRVHGSGRHRPAAALPDERLQPGPRQIEVPGQVDVAADIVDRDAAIGIAAGDLAGSEIDLHRPRIEGQPQPGVRDLVAVPTAPSAVAATLTFPDNVPRTGSVKDAFDHGAAGSPVGNGSMPRLESVSQPRSIELTERSPSKRGCRSPPWRP